MEVHISIDLHCWKGCEERQFSGMVSKIYLLSLLEDFKK